MTNVVTEFTPIASTLGGVLIGLSAVVLMLFQGRIAGITGVLGRLLPPFGDSAPAEAAVFVAGLLLAPLIYPVLAGTSIVQTVSDSVPLMVAGGLLVGVGTGLGGGCTSGHGVCGLALLSPRSLVATLTFMATGFLTVYAARHLLGV
jgi:uncharacterized membrane protein YedE/YeeE